MVEAEAAAVLEGVEAVEAVEAEEAEAEEAEADHHHQCHHPRQCRLQCQ